MTGTESKPYLCVILLVCKVVHTGLTTMGDKECRYYITQHYDWLVFIQYTVFQKTIPFLFLQ